MSSDFPAPIINVALRAALAKCEPTVRTRDVREPADAGRATIETSLESTPRPIFIGPCRNIKHEKAAPVAGAAWHAINESGGRDRDRTCDPYHVKVVLYR